MKYISLHAIDAAANHPCIFFIIPHAVEEAMKYVMAQKLKEKKREEDEKKLFDEEENEQTEAKSQTSTKNQDSGLKETGFETEESKMDAEMDEHGTEEEVVEDDLWDWTDQDQVSKFRFNTMMFVHSSCVA